MKAGMIGLALLLLSSTAEAKDCVIVFSGGTNGNYAEKEEHEFAHAIGWEHPVRGSFEGKSFPVPERYKRAYRAWKAGHFTPACNLIPYRVSLLEAKRICGGAYGCQWFQ